MATSYVEEIRKVKGLRSPENDLWMLLQGPNPQKLLNYFRYLLL